MSDRSFESPVELLNRTVDSISPGWPSYIHVAEFWSHMSVFVQDRQQGSALPKSDGSSIMLGVSRQLAWG